MLNSSALYGLTKACVVMPLVEKVEGVCPTPTKAITAEKTRIRKEETYIN